MPKLKRSVKGAPDKTGFESYGGPEPRQGIYRGKIKAVSIKEASTGRQGFNILVELEAKKGDKDHAKFDGYPAWVRLWFSDKEMNLAREKQFYRALGLKTDEPDVIHDDLDDGGKVSKIGGKNPVGAVVNVDIKNGRYEGEFRAEPDAIYPVKDDAPEEPDEDEDEELEDDDDLMEDEDDVEEEEDDLDDLSLPELRKIAKELGINTRGKSQSDLVDEITDARADAADADEDEDEAEVDADGDPIEDDDEDDEDEESPDYSAMSLPELRKAARAAKLETKGMSKDDLIAALSGEDDEEEEEESEGPTVADAMAWKLPELKKFAREEGGYSNDDLKGLKAKEIIEMLVDDEVLSSDGNEPPF